MRSNCINQRGAAQQWLLGGLVVALILVAAGLAIKKHSDPRDVASQSTVSGYDKRIEHPTNIFKLTLDDGAYKSGPTKITVKQGSVVRVDFVVSGEEVGITLDGYDIISEANPEAPGAFSFVADKSGSFDFYVIGESKPDESTPPAKHKLGTIIVEK